MRLTRKLQQQKNRQFMITVPRDICRLKGWEKGEELTWKEEDGELKKGKSNSQKPNVDKWIDYYNKINSALYDAGVLNVIKASSL